MEATQYQPFQPVPEAYKEGSKAQTMARILGAFNDVLGIPPAIIKTQFRGYLEELVNRVHPRYRCSSARAVIEGKIPGIPNLVDGLPAMLKGRVRKALSLLDILETMAGEYLDKAVTTLEGEGAIERTRIKKVLGTTKVPGKNSKKD